MSIFSFKGKIATALFTAATVSGIFGYGLRAHQTRTPEVLPVDPTSASLISVTREQFFLKKLRQEAAYDVVVAGDSRVVSGVSPDHIGKFLPSARIFNFGFYAACFSNDYLKAVEALLDPRSTNPVIVLGVSSQALTERNLTSNGFHTYNRMTRPEELTNVPLRKTFRFFQPFLSDDLDGVRRIYHSNGWIEENRERNPGELEKLRQYYRGSKLSEKMVSELLQQVSEWKKGGTQVCGFFIPVSEAVRDLESKVIDFDERGFIDRFTDAGGRWIYFDATQYEWNDGHHLAPIVAARFSEDLGRALANELSSEPGTFERPVGVYRRLSSKTQHKIKPW